MTDQIERYCNAHKTAVTIHRQSSGEKVIMLVCEHTFDPNVFKCDLRCVYEKWAQTGAAMAAEMAPALLNSDGTIRLDVMQQATPLVVDYTSKMPKRSVEAVSKKDVLEMEYFEVACPAGDGFCGDRNCPCPPPGTKIPRGAGYLYISQEVVDFRRDARSAQEAQEKVNRMRKELDMTVVIVEPGVIQPILMCEQGARLRGLDLNIAAADARYWWETGLVPLRATPLADSRQSPPKKRKWWQFWES
jgi:hypothetical protein